MPSWFKKVFKGGEDAAADSGSHPGRVGAGTVSVAEPFAASASGGNGGVSTGRRKVVHAPVLSEAVESPAPNGDIRIKARVEADGMSCVLMVDRPVFEGHSIWLTEAEMAGSVSPLAEALFEVEGVGSVLIHDTTLSLSKAYTAKRSWEEMAAEAGRVVRLHLQSGQPAISERFLEAIPPSEEIRRRIQTCIDLEINPGIASHSGVVTLERVVGNTVFITMGGGCQGCAASDITLRQGIHNAFREAVPQVGAILDETDHAAGDNPFFTEIPEGMV